MPVAGTAAPPARGFICGDIAEGREAKFAGEGRRARDEVTGREL
jgi:hypothetical protein